MTPNRRELLSGFSLTSAALLLAGEGHPLSALGSAGQEGGNELAPAYRGQRPLVPLPFDPKKLEGLSERLVVSHHENNYGGAVRNLNKVEAALAQISKDTPSFVVAGLKERELTFSNSVTLHELYFGNLGGKEGATGEVAKAIGATYSTFGRWEEEFRAVGASLGGGSGWVILSLELPTRTLRTHASGHHSQAKAAALPLLVMDMYEHAYQMDYGAAAAKYVDAFFANVRWEEVDRRYARAVKAAEALGS